MLERLVAFTLLAAIGVYLASAWGLPRGTIERPGPGFYPVAVGLFGAAAALTWVVSTLRRPVGAPPVAAAGLPAPAAAQATPALDHPAARKRVIVTGALLVGFCLALPWIGYPPAAFAFVLLALRGMGAGWLPALSIGLITAGASYYVFGILLGVPLPGGVLFA
jgi:hypothetical protein